MYTCAIPRTAFVLFLTVIYRYQTILCPENVSLKL